MRIFINEYWWVVFKLIVLLKGNVNIYPSRYIVKLGPKKRECLFES